MFASFLIFKGKGGGSFFSFFSGEGAGTFFVVGEVHRYLNIRDLKPWCFDVACALQSSSSTRLTKEKIKWGACSLSVCLHLG